MNKSFLMMDGNGIGKGANGMEGELMLVDGNVTTMIEIEARQCKGKGQAE